MKAFIALLAGVALLPGPALARQPVLDTADDAVSITTCTVSGDASSLTASFTLTSGSAISGISGGVIAGITIPPAGNGEEPSVTAHAINTKGAGQDRAAHAINTKGMGSGDRAAHAIKSKGAGGVDRTAHAIKTKGCGSEERSAGSDGSVAVPQMACAISADDMSVSVTDFALPVSSKASFQDLSFVTASNAKILAAGPGGGPRVLARCSGADGTPSSITMLLLPAVQK